MVFFFFKQKTAYEIGTGDWSSDVCSSDLNASKTQFINLSLSEPRQPETYSMKNVTIKECDTVKLLGVTIDKRLTFSKHVNDVTESLASRLYAMRQLKRLGLKSSGLKLFYLSNIRSRLTYACQAWSGLMNDNSMTQIIRVEKAAMRIVNPDLEYENCLQTYHIPPIEGYIDQQCQNHYQTILLNTTHPLHKNIVLNTNRKTRVLSAVRMPLCRTEKLKKSFFFKYANC